MSDTEAWTSAIELTSQIFGRTQRLWLVAYNFRRMGQLGLPAAINVIKKENEDMLEELKVGEKGAQWFPNRDEMVKAGFFDGMAAEMTNRSVDSYTAALDVATLIFLHSLVDDIALSWCKVCSLIAPDDFLPYIEKNKSQ